jgi:hypothetical protein
MANRFDKAYVSAYNPLSMEELAMAPMIKRKQHDDTLAKQELIRSGLAKVDPYSKHFDEAITLKNQLEGQMDATAQELATEGINNNMIGKTLALNREFQDLTAPTGKLGQINAEKQNILKINEEYDKLGKEKNWGQETTNYWKQKALDEYNATPIYDDNNRILKYSGPQGVANKVDYNKWLDDLASKAKMSTSEFANAVTQLGKDEASGYNVATKNSFSRKLGDNYAAVKAAYDTLKLTMNDPTSEVYKSMQYERRDPKALLDILNTQQNVYKQSMDATERGNDLNPFGDGSGAPDTTMPSGTFDPDSQKTIDLSTDLGNIDKINGKYWSDKDENDYKWGQNQSMEKTGVHTYKTVFRDNPILEKIYENTYQKLVKNKKLSTKDGINSEKAKSLIKFYMNNNVPKTITTGNDVIRPDISPNGQLFMGELAGKSPADRDATLTQDIRGDEDNPAFRTMLDSKTLEPVELGDGERIQYVGYDSPINVRNYKFGNKYEQNVMAHKAQVLDKNGNFVRNVTISRTPQETKAPEFKKGYEINQIYRNALINFGEWVQPTGTYSGSSRVKQFKVRYNADGTFQLKFGSKESEKMDAGRYGVEMNAILSDVK